MMMSQLVIVMHNPRHLAVPIGTSANVGEMTQQTGPANQTSLRFA